MKSSSEEEQTNDNPADNLQIVVPEMPQWATNEGDDTGPVEDENFGDRQDVVSESPEEPMRVEEEPVKEEEGEPAPKVVEEKPAPKEVPKIEDGEPKQQTHQVKFSDSLILTSYKSPPPGEEKKEQSPIKPILKPALKTESPPLKREQPKVQPPSPKRVMPVLERKVADRPPLVKPPLAVQVQVAGVQTEQKEEEKQPAEEPKMAEEKTEEPPKLEPQV